MSVSTIDDIMLTEAQLIQTDDPLRDAKRMMVNSAARSLIVNEGNNVVGILTWPQVRDLSGDELDAPVPSIMMRDFPVLRPGQSLQDAQTAMGHDINVEEIPVINDAGELVGVVRREALAHESTSVSPSPGAAGSGYDPELAPIRKGMTVYGSAGAKLGAITEADFRSDGGVENFTVEHGLVFKKHKQLPGDVIQEITGEEVRLLIDETEFDLIQNTEDIEA